jgi:hypothetical protein
MQCSNHLKQIGIAIHNFHDVRDGIPPAGVGGFLYTWNPQQVQRPGFFVFLWSFVEQQALYDIVVNHGFDQSYGVNFWVNGASGIDIEAFRRGSALSIYRCPTRRGGGGQAMNPVLTVTGYGARVNDGDWWAGMPGPCTDYAYVKAVRTWFGPWDNWNHESDATGHYRNHWGPVRLAILEQRNPNFWQPRDAFSWIADGLSNQIIVGEKHIPIGTLGECFIAEGSEGAVGASDKYMDCSYLGHGLIRGFASSQAIRRWGGPEAGGDGYMTPLRRPNDQYGDGDFDHGGSAGFGSYHPGICQFLLGDGAVRSVSITTPPRILASLADVSDGEAVSLP